MTQRASLSPTEPAHAVPSERSASGCFRSGQEVHCHQKETNFAWLGRIRDISCRGIALILRKHYEPGTFLIVERETRADWPQRFLVRVVRATQRATGPWVIGCAFAEPLSEQQLRDFIEGSHRKHGVGNRLAAFDTHGD